MKSSAKLILISDCTDSDRAMPSEKWLPMPDFEGLYEVSSIGRVRSLYFDPPRNCKPGRDADGYLTVAVTKAGRRTTKRVHRLVCRAFHGEPYLVWNEAAHLDGDRANAEADNLKWVTKVENRHQRTEHGNNCDGERHPMSSLTDRQAEQIRARRWATTRAALAEQYGVSVYVIDDVLRGRTYKVRIASQAARCSTVSHTVMPERCREGGQAKPQGRKLHAAILTSGHRTYLDPNPRLVHTRTTAWNVPTVRGHRQWIGDKR